MLFVLHWLGFKSKGVITIKVERKEAIHLKNLAALLRTKLLNGEAHHFEGGVKIAKVAWTERTRKWGGTPPTIELEYDKENAFMLRMAISYKKRQAAKTLAFNADELYTRLIQELDKAKLFVNADSSTALASSKSPGAVLPPLAAGATGATGTKKDAETSKPSATKKYQHKQHMLKGKHRAKGDI